MPIVVEVWKHPIARSDEKRKVDMFKRKSLRKHRLVSVTYGFNDKATRTKSWKSYIRQSNLTIGACRADEHPYLDPAACHLRHSCAWISKLRATSSTAVVNTEKQCRTTFSLPLL